MGLRSATGSREGAVPSAVERDASDLMAWVIMGHRPPEVGFLVSVTMSPIHSRDHVSNTLASPSVSKTGTVV